MPRQKRRATTRNRNLGGGGQQFLGAHFDSISMQHVAGSSGRQLPRVASQVAASFTSPHLFSAAGYNWHLAPSCACVCVCVVATSKWLYTTFQRLSVCLLLRMTVCLSASLSLSPCVSLSLLLSLLLSLYLSPPLSLLVLPCVFVASKKWNFAFISITLMSNSNSNSNDAKERQPWQWQWQWQLQQQLATELTILSQLTNCVSSATFTASSSFGERHSQRRHFIFNLHNNNNNKKKRSNNKSKGVCTA